MASPVWLVKTGYVTASSYPGASSVPVYKKTTGSYAKFYTKTGAPIGQGSLVQNASGTVKTLGDFLKVNKKVKAKTPTKAKSPSPAKAKSPSPGYVNTNLTTLLGKPIVKHPVTKNYYWISAATQAKIQLTQNDHVKKPNGSIVKISNLNKSSSPAKAKTPNAGAGYTKIPGIVTLGGYPVYFMIAQHDGKAVFSMFANNIYKYIPTTYPIYKASDTAHANPIRIKNYFASNNAFTNTGKKSSNGKTVYKHKYLSNLLSVKNGNTYTAKFKGKATVQKNLGLVTVPKPKPSATPKPAPAPAPAPASTPPVVISVTLVPVVKPGPDHVKARVDSHIKAVDRVAEKIKELREATNSGNNKTKPVTKYGFAYMNRRNTLTYRYTKVPGLTKAVTVAGLPAWRQILTKPKFVYATYQHKQDYTQYLAHKQLLFRYGRNVNSFENVRLSDMMDLKWYAEQDKYIRTLSSREIMTINGYSFNGDQWAHLYLNGTFDYDVFRSKVRNLGNTYFAYFFQARDFYKINTGDMNKDYDETVKRASTDMNNDNIRSIIHMFINDLNEIIRKSPSVTRSFILFRGNKDDKYLSGAVNNTYTTERFCSASVDGNLARTRFSGDHELQRITVLKGSKCLLMFGVTQVEDEWEVLLPRGSTYQIVKRRKDVVSNQSKNLNTPHPWPHELKYLTDVVLLGTVEEAKQVEAVPVEIHPTTNAHVMEKYIKNWPVKITGSLGKGGMGNVYQGINTKSKQNIAIKFQKKSTNSNAEKIGLRKLNGLNIAPKLIRNKTLNANNYLASVVPGHKVKAGNKMNVMESTLIKGQALKKWYTGAPIPKEIANKVKNTVSKMHARGVIHGDLHRNNIIMGNNGRAYIIDFGRAIVTNSSFKTPKNANNKLRTLGPLGRRHNKNIVTGPNGRFHFFNGQFLNKMIVAP